MCIMFEKIGVIAEKIKQPRLQGSVTVHMAMEVMDIYEIDIIGVECEDEFAGIFSRKDFERKVVRQNLDSEETTLYEVISLNPPTVMPYMTLKEAYEAMLSYRWDYIPVVLGKKLYGIVSIADLGKNVLESFEETKNEYNLMMNYIQNGGESYAKANYDS